MMQNITSYFLNACQIWAGDNKFLSTTLFFKTARTVEGITYLWFEIHLILHPLLDYAKCGQHGWKSSKYGYLVTTLSFWLAVHRANIGKCQRHNELTVHYGKNFSRPEKSLRWSTLRYCSKIAGRFIQKADNILRNVFYKKLWSFWWLRRVDFDDGVLSLRLKLCTFI